MIRLISSIKLSVHYGTYKFHKYNLDDFAMMADMNNVNTKYPRTVYED